MSASRNPMWRLAIKTSARAVAALTNRGHSARPSFITNQSRFDHHGGGETRLAREIGFVPRVLHRLALRHLYGGGVASASSVDSRTPAHERIDRVLRDLVQPSNYVTWEYFSRQRLLARGIVGSRRAQRTRVLDIGCGHGALSLTLAESAGFDVVAMDVLESRVRAVGARRATRDPEAAARGPLVRAVPGCLALPGEAVDGAAASEVLQHLDAPGRMLAEARRVLPPARRFLLTTPNS